MKWSIYGFLLQLQPMALIMYHTTDKQVTEQMNAMLPKLGHDNEKWANKYHFSDLKTVPLHSVVFYKILTQTLQTLLLHLEKKMFHDSRSLAEHNKASLKSEQYTAWSGLAYSCKARQHSVKCTTEVLNWKNQSQTSATSICNRLPSLSQENTQASDACKLQIQMQGPDAYHVLEDII